ncbi:bestrophin homolog 22-like isoform X2 [Tigriopus californicus]|uniref:bestrophin homolog 22-like isoform X2 n=1 Tax=Tigriopus californicus TaxID=6832 RepID=UPI0027DA6309|nr:bestrophin homolog 22-like isoform X2 [Tigriopus californicus]
MTISYQRDVASSTAGGFTRILFKWKGSLYKLIYRELLLFQLAYVFLSLVYRQLLTRNQRVLFEMVVKYFDAFLNLIPLSFVLGFYVSYVASRWWQQFLAIPWPDKLFHSIACFVQGFDEESRILRRSLMRYMNLALILVLRSISSAVKQRFPNLEHVVEAGFMTNQEKELFSAVPSNEFNTYWIPCTWFVYRIQEASKKGKLLNAYALDTIMREFCDFRAKCGLLWCYDWVSIPMVYTQVVTLATYLFFIFTVIGRQKIDTLRKGEYMRSGRMPMDIDLYIPIYTILQFFFFMGLLKVAEQLINPFGDDDEDFELNWLLDRHMKASFLGCDILMDPDRIPPLVKDFYWDKQNCPIPYTEASMHFKRKTYKGSADDMIVPESKQQMVLPEIEEEDEDQKHQSRLSLTSLLLDSTHLVTGASMGPGYLSNKKNQTSNIVTKIGLGDSSNVLQDVDHHEDYTHSKSLFPPDHEMKEFRRSLPEGAFPAEDQNSRHHFTPGSWRNGGQQANGSPGNHRQDGTLNSSDSHLMLPDMSSNFLRRLSDTNLANHYWGGSVDKESVTDEDDSDRRGSVAGSSCGTRRGSKLSDLIEKKKPAEKKKRKKDKQGFVWRRMIHEDTEELPRTRTPHLGSAGNAQGWLNQSSMPTPTGSQSGSSQTVRHLMVLPENAAKSAPKPTVQTPIPIPQLVPRKTSPDANGIGGRRGNRLRPIDLPQRSSSAQAAPRVVPQHSVDDDSASITSFKTCPSEPNLAFVPRQVSDNYDTGTIVRSPTSDKGGRSAADQATKAMLRSNSYATDPPRPGLNRISAIQIPGTGVQQPSAPELDYPRTPRTPAPNTSISPNAQMSAMLSKVPSPSPHIRWKPNNSEQ